jgi:hypothetical protein
MLNKFYFEILLRIVLHVFSLCLSLTASFRIACLCLSHQSFLFLLCLGRGTGVDEL